MFIVRHEEEKHFQIKELLHSFSIRGAQLIVGKLSAEKVLLDAVKQADVVISVLGHEPEQLNEQFKIIKAIKEAGNVKRFIPSEFGMDVERAELVEPAKTALAIKVQLRQVIREEGIPHTFVCNNFFHSFLLPRLGQITDADSPPTDEVTIVGNGDTQAIFINEQDVSTYTIKAVDDPRTLNKILYARPPENFFSLNQLVSLWEKKTATYIDRVYVSEEDHLSQITHSSYPLNFQLAIMYSAFIKGEQTKYDIDPSVGVEATELYPEVAYLTVEGFMDRLLSSIQP
ncbi:hypothetical protein LUZ60_004582 [Juncus effusus]|nr:hypothetical protein LUZ60_004582 [Juncus effusus]